MSYNYQDQRPWIFSDEGVTALLVLKTAIAKMLEVSNCFRMDALYGKAPSGTDLWQVHACVDYLVEKHELQEFGKGPAGQYRVFMGPWRH